MKCPNCQTENKENTRYCSKCGLDLIIYKDGVKKESIEKSKTYGQYSDAQDYLMDGSKVKSKENFLKPEIIADTQDEDQKKLSESQSKEENSKSDKPLEEKDKSATINSNKPDSQNVSEKKEKTDKNEKSEKKEDSDKKDNKQKNKSDEPKNLSKEEKKISKKAAKEAKKARVAQEKAKKKADKAAKKQSKKNNKKDISADISVPEKKSSQGKKMTGAAFEISSKDRGLRLAAFVINLITTILTGILLIPLC